MNNDPITGITMTRELFYAHKLVGLSARSYFQVGHIVTLDHPAEDLIDMHMRFCSTLSRANIPLSNSLIRVLYCLIREDGTLGFSEYNEDGYVTKKAIFGSAGLCAGHSKEEADELIKSAFNVYPKALADLKVRHNFARETRKQVEENLALCEIDWTPSSVKVLEQVGIKVSPREHL